MKLPKVSIIVPVYNAEKYLSVCLESLINQTYENYEIILINDGSTDRSLEICNQFVKMSDKIYVIDQKNSGVSKARNKGLEKATGKYICFVDSDDWIDKTMIFSLSKTVIEQDANFVMCNLIKEFSNSKKYISSGFTEGTVLNSEEIKEQLVLGLIEKNENETEHILAPFRGPVGKLYDLEVIRKNNLYFNEDLIIGEDFLFNLEFLIKCKTAVIVEDYYYHYMTNNESITMKYKEGCWSQIYELTLEKIEDFLVKNQYQEIAKQKFGQLVSKYYIFCLNNELRKENSNKISQKVNVIKKMHQSNYIENSIKQINKFNRSRFYIKPIVLFLTRYKLATILYIYLYIREQIKRIIQLVLLTS